MIHLDFAPLSYDIHFIGIVRFLLRKINDIIFLIPQITPYDKIKYIVCICSCRYIQEDNLWGFSIFRMSAKATKVAKNMSDKGNCTKYHHNIPLENKVSKMTGFNL